MRLLRAARLVTIGCSIILFLFIFQTIIGFYWTSYQQKIGDISLKIEDITFKGGIFSPLKVICGQVTIHHDALGSSVSCSNPLQNLSLLKGIKKFAWIKKIDVYVEKASYNEFSMEKLIINSQIDYAYDFIDILLISFKNCKKEKDPVSIPYFQQNHCVQIDMKDNKMHFSFKKPTDLHAHLPQISEDPLVLQFLMTGEITAKNIFLQGSANFINSLSNTKIDYRYNGNSIFLEGLPGQYCTIAKQENAWIGEAEWFFNLDSLPDVLYLKSKKWIYDTKHSFLQADLAISCQDNLLKGNIDWNVLSKSGIFHEAQISLPVLRNFSGTGNLFYDDGELEAEIHGEWDDFVEDRRAIRIAYSKEEIRITPKEKESDTKFDWTELKIQLPNQKYLEWLVTATIPWNNSNWIACYYPYSEIFQIYRNDKKEASMISHGKAHFSDQGASFSDTYLLTNFNPINTYEWNGRYEPTSHNLVVNAHDTQNRLPNILFHANLDDLYQINNFECWLNGLLLTASIKGNSTDISIESPLIDLDQWQEILGYFDFDDKTITSNTQSKDWFSYPTEIFPLKQSLKVTADKIRWNKYDFHKFSATHNYNETIKEHRWNAHYREGSLCFREYQEDAIWKQESTLILSSGEFFDPSIKEGLWILSLYHDPLKSPKIIWHIKIDDIFIDKWKHPAFTSLNVLSGQAFTPRQARSFVEEGVMIEKIYGRGSCDRDALTVDFIEMNAGAVWVKMKGLYYIGLDDFDMELIVRPKISKALSSVATLINPWSAGLAFIGVKSIGKDLDTWNEQLYQLKGSFSRWDIKPWEPEVLSFGLSTD